MSPKAAAVALFVFGALVVGCGMVRGSPWPGVALVALSLIPWGVSRLERSEAQQDELHERIDAEGEARDTEMRMALSAIKAHGEQIAKLEEDVNALKSLRALEGM